MELLDLALILFFAFILLWILITYKFGDWRNWKLYYSTILFFWCGNLIAFEVLHDRLLWEFKSNMLSHWLVDLLQMFFIFTCTTILYLQYYPKKMMNKVFYIILWVFVYSIIEWIFHLMGSIVYSHGWTIYWSVIHNFYQFILLRIHYKNPVLAWILAFIMFVVIMRIFHVI